MKIIWAITGAGHLLRESIAILEEISKKHTITLILSPAGREVVTLYGLNKKLEEITKRKENNEILESEERYSYPFSGKLTHEKYDFVIIAPTTANTTAKIANGIADTLVTNVASQSGKGRIPLIVLPVDQKEGPVTTIIPPYINKDECRKCKECTPKIICPQDAIKPPTIDSAKCIGCMKCENTCKYDALVTNEKIELYIRKIDAENTRKLEKIENITTIRTPNEILEIIKRIEVK